MNFVWWYCRYCIWLGSWYAMNCLFGVFLITLDIKEGRLLYFILTTSRKQKMIRSYRVYRTRIYQVVMCNSWQDAEMAAKYVLFWLFNLSAVSLSSYKSYIANFSFLFQIQVKYFLLIASLKGRTYYQCWYEQMSLWLLPRFYTDHS